jgi:hypothetical protein
MDLRRVTVVGTSCSGKTTFATALAAALDVPQIELDALHWQPNWVEAPAEVFRADVAAAVAAERWVSDGNYSVVRDRETLGKAFLSRDSILLWVVTSYRRGRHQYAALFADCPFGHLDLLELRTPVEAARFLRERGAKGCRAAHRPSHSRRSSQGRAEP